MKWTMRQRTNIESVLQQKQIKAFEGQDVQKQIKTLLKGLHIDGANDLDFDLLETDNIYHLSQIKAVCIDYRLRFLDQKYFKGEIPQKAKDKINALESDHNTVLSGFKIMAPSVLFRLSKTDDPLLFVPVGNDYYYLVHKWGNDLSPYRKLLMWPYKNLMNLIAVILLVSFLVTLITPYQIFTKTNDSSTFFMLFLFMFKAVASVVLFYGFALGKNFNKAIWNSRYNKS